MSRCPASSRTGLLLAAVFLGALAGPSRAASPGQAAPRETLVWSDEFEGPAGAAPDPLKWGYDVGHGHDGWGNKEMQYYCAPGDGEPCDPKNPSVRLDGRGRLVIEAARGPSGLWTSGRAKTQGLFEPESGRVEARMRLPTGVGLWTAFWMLGADIASAGWPACGEIDIMENVFEGIPGALGPGRIMATAHGPGYSGPEGGIRGIYALPGGGRVDDGFHVYGVRRSSGSLVFYVDDPGKPFFRATPSNLPEGRTWVFDRPFYLLLNLAVGGGWPGPPDETTSNPARMLVDWVRVYRSE